MSSLEALWGGFFFAGSKGPHCSERSEGSREYLASNLGLVCLFIYLLLYLIHYDPRARQDGADGWHPRRGHGCPAGNRGEWLQPFAKLLAGNKVHPKRPQGFFAASSSPQASRRGQGKLPVGVAVGRGRRGTAPGPPGPSTAGFTAWVGISKRSVGQNCSRPCGIWGPQPMAALGAARPVGSCRPT